MTHDIENRPDLNSGKEMVGNGFFDLGNLSETE